MLSTLNKMKPASLLCKFHFLKIKELMINFSSTKTRYTNFDYTMEYQYFSVNFMFVSKICGPELSEYKRRKKNALHLSSWVVLN